MIASRLPLLRYWSQSMNEIRYDQASSTFSGQASSPFNFVVMAGLVAMQVLHTAPPKAFTEHRNIPLLQSPYSLDGNKATFNNYSNPITGAYDSAPSGFEQAVGNFYARLLASQEPLGAEFERVLYDNLWDLYES